MVKSQNDVRDIIVNAARDIFARFGFKKTTMDEIARAVRMGKSSLYHYFNSKDDVFQAVVEKESRILQEEINRAIDKEDCPLKKMRAYVITRMKVLKRVANFYNALKDEYFEHYGFEKMRAKYFKDEVNTIKKVLKTGVEKGIFNIKELDITAFAMITALKGFEYSWAVENDIYEIEKNIDSLLEVLFYGIIKR